MEEEHCDILLTQRANLVAKINMRGGLLTQLLSRKVIDARGMRVIKTHKILDEMCEEMLDTLPQCGSKAFDLFCEALKADGQEEIVTLYLKPPQSNEPEAPIEDNRNAVQESGNQTGKGGKQQTQPKLSDPQTSSGSNSMSMGDSSLVVTDSGVGSASGLSDVNLRHGLKFSQPVAVHEEFQSVRRYIEPVQSNQGPSLMSSPGKFHSPVPHYQNWPMDSNVPSQAIYSVVCDNSLSSMEKERILLQMGVHAPFQDILHNFGDSKAPMFSRDFMHEKYDQNNLYKGSYRKDDNNEHIIEPSSLAMHQRYSQSPNVFNQSPQKPKTPFSEPRSPFTFRSKEQVQQNNDNFANRNLQEQFDENSRDREFKRENDFNRHLIQNQLNIRSSGQIYGQNVERNVDPQLSRFRDDLENRPVEINRHESSQNMETSFRDREDMEAIEKHHGTKGGNQQLKGDYQQLKGDYQQLTSERDQSRGGNSSQPEREFFEIPRHVEMEGGRDNERTMFSLPRYIEKQLPVARHPDGEEGEFTQGQITPKLLRNDSVDTMHKRPFVEEQESNNKRFREDVDSVQNLASVRSPLQTAPVNITAQHSTAQHFSALHSTAHHSSAQHSANQHSSPISATTLTQRPSTVAIPVIEEPKRRPSMPRFVIQTDNDLEKLQRSSLLGVMDDPEIDLTDGPIDVKVELSTRQFYLQHYKKSYAMRRIPRGKALVLNVNTVVGKTERRGTDIDRDNLDNLLCQLHFDVTVYNDSDGLTAIEMVKKLQDFSQHPGHAVADCTVVCILSHGEEGYIFGADGRKFELDAIFQLFDNTCCPDLRGKPKLFIIQACRGGALDRGVQYYPDEHDGSDARVRQVPSMSDMLICFPTQTGYYAWRNRDRGSWYVEALVQVFMKYAHCEDVCTMLNRVNLLVSKKVSHCPNLEMDQMSQMSEYKSTLRMPHLFFFPGIAGMYDNTSLNTAACNNRS